MSYTTLPEIHAPEVCILGSGQILVQPLTHDHLPSNTWPYYGGELPPFLALMRIKSGNKEIVGVLGAVPGLGAETVSLAVSNPEPEDIYVWVANPPLSIGIERLWGRAYPSPPAPAGHEYRYSWSGDGSGTNQTTDSWITQTDDGCPYYLKAYNATVTVTLVRLSDEEVICSETATIIGDPPPPGCEGFGPYDPPHYSLRGLPTDEDIEFCDELDFLLVDITPRSGCPGDTITAIANYPLASAAIGATNLPLTNISGNTYTFLIPYTVTTADTYSIDFTSSSSITIPTVTQYIVVPESCFDEPPDECIPPLPDICISSLSEIHLEPVPVAEFPDCTSTLRLELYTPQNGWEVVKTGIVANTPYTVTTTVTTGLKARFISDDDTVGQSVEVTEFCCDGGGGDPDEQNPPATPAAPTVDPDCEDEEVAVTSPPFSTIPGAFTKHIELQRRTLPAGAWETVHTFDSATSWVDNNVQGGNKYEYRARACNAAGCSAWSASAPADLVSSNLTITIIEPMANQTLSGRQDIIFTLADTGADYDPCNPPDPLPDCVDADIDLSVTLDGMSILPAAKLIEGAPRNGVYKIRRWDTRNHANGTHRNITIKARGTDCCFALSSIQTTVNNNIINGTRYTHIYRNSNLPSGLEYNRGQLSLVSEQLSEQPHKRYWVFSGIASRVTHDFSGNGDHEAAFTALQRVVLKRYNEHNGVRNIGNSFTLKKAGAQIHWVMQWVPFQSLQFYETGLERIVKIRPLADDKSMVFATSPTDAKVFTFSKDTLTLLADLADYDASNAHDVALLKDKLYIASSGRLIVADTDGDETLDLTPRGEFKPLMALEIAFNRIIALFSDGSTTTGYDLDWSTPRKLWDLPFGFNIAYGAESGLVVTNGAEYFSALSLTATPALRFTFPQEITALDSYKTGLADGSIWGVEMGSTNPVELVGASGTPVSAIGNWDAGEINIYGVAARGDNRLLQQGITSWGEYNVEAPVGVSGSVDVISALMQQPKSPNQEEEGVEISRLLIGTGNDGLLAVISTSNITASDGATIMSKAGHLAIQPFWGVIPEVE